MTYSKISTKSLGIPGFLFRVFDQNKQLVQICVTEEEAKAYIAANS